MINKTEDIKSCTNCKFFTRYYKKTATRFVPLCNGFCTGRTLKWYEKRNIPLSEGCENWEPLIEDTKENNQRIHEVLLNMQKQLGELILIINDK